MLRPIQKLIVVTLPDGNKRSEVTWVVWDVEKEKYVETGFFKQYKSKEACQEAIDFFNSFEIVNVS